MKSLRSLIVVALAVAGVTAAMAQATYTDKEGNTYTFKGHWFLNLQGGVQNTLDNDADFMHQFSPNLQLGIGYQFTPVFGLRVQANAWRSKGGWDDFGETNYTNHYRYRYIAPGVDAIFNLSNAVAGWKPKRFFNLSAFLGAGINVAGHNDYTYELSYSQTQEVKNTLDDVWLGTSVRAFGRAGLIFDFRLCDAVSFNIEANANMTTDTYNSKEEHNPDWYFNALAGFKINLGKTYTKKSKPAPAPEPPKPVERKAEPVPAPEPAPAPEPEPEPEPVKVKAEPIERAIFFTINTTTITASEQVKIDEVVKYLNDNPEAKVTVTGHADSGTGNEEINNKLAAKRANTTVNALKAAGIDASRISSSSKGDKEQPFAENDKNRCAIVIAAE